MSLHILSKVRSQLQNWLRIVLVLVAVAIYANSLQVPYQFDDGIAFVQVIPNDQETAYDQALALFQYPARVIPMMSFFVQFHTTDENLFFLHTANIALHLANTFLVFWLAQQLLRLLAVKGHQHKNALSIAFFAALIFAVHPINTQAVTYLVQRMTSIAALFSLLSVNLLLYSVQMMQLGKTNKQLLSLAGMGLTCVAALYSKENAVVLPIVLFLTLMMTSLRLTVKGFFQKYGILLVVLAVVTVVLVLLRPNIINEALQPRLSPAGFPYTPLTYGLTQLSLYPRYIGMVVLPIGQSIDHLPTPFTQVQSPVIIGGITVLALLGIALFFLKKHPIVSFGILWYMLFMLVEGSIIPINDSFVEHRLYLPSIGLLIASTYALFQSRWVRKKNFPLVICLSLIIVGLSVATFKRNQVWQTQESLWRDASIKAPHNPRALYNYSVHAIRAVHPQEALVALYAAIELRPDYHMAQNNLGVLLFAIGDYEGARLHFFEALRYQISNETYAMNLDRSIRAVDTDTPSTELPSLIEEMFH